MNQVGILLAKNFLLYYKQKELIKDAIFLAVLIGIIYALNINDDPTGQTPYYISLAVVSYSRTMYQFIIRISSWVSQKQSKQKELQKIMGLSSSSYLIGWLIYYLILGTMISMSFICILCATKSVPVNAIPLYFLYMLSLFSFTLFLSVFFQTAKGATIIITFILIIFANLYWLVSWDKFQESFLAIFICSLIPSAALSIGYYTIVNQLVPLNWSFQWAMGLLTLDAVIYLILFFYLQAVWPNEYGTNKHPLFFLPFRNKSSSSQQNNQIDLALLGSQKNVDCSALYYQKLDYQNRQKSVIIRRLVKKYQDFVAVDGVSLALYPGQIFCLLGHNGAGKSTTINVLTGLIKKTSGQIQINGLNYDYELSQIRKNLGFCPQSDVLYDNLTIQQHLNYYAKIKGTIDVQAQVENIIEKCALKEQKGKIIKNLSGGNKRKVSLAIALVGGSKTVFLDQPSSGLDPDSRRNIWKILQLVKKQNRTIVLTTHHLDQAQHLAQRIAIMAKGRLLTLGDPQFIKKKFGIGYLIQLQIQNQGQKKEALQILKEEIPQGKLDIQSAANILKYVAPFYYKNKFTLLFKKLERIHCRISLNNSSLQDAFINIGMDQDRFINQLEGKQIDKDQKKQYQKELILPSAIQKQPTLSFKIQLKTLIYKKLLTTIRSPSLIFSLFLPLLFIIIGIVVASIAITGTLPINNAVRFFILGYFMTWAFVFNTGSYCGSIVYQREKKLRYALHVMGCGQIQYWLSNLIFDLTAFIVTMIPFFIGIPFCGITIVENNYGLMLILIASFSPSLMLYSYVWSFVFQKSNTAYRAFPIINFILFFALPQIPFIILKQQVLAVLGGLWSPFLCLYYGILSDNFQIGLFQTGSLWLYIGFLWSQTIIYTILIIIMQKLRSSYKIRQQQFQAQQQANDVKQEQNRMQIQFDDPIRVQNLYKQYPNGFMAIHNNTFAVREGEIFGLLGPNGAGKSTTFNILTAALAPSSGKIKLQNNLINSQIMPSIYKDVSICPQYDSIYQNLTVRENIDIFAGIKGLENNDRNQIVQFYMKIMGITEYQNVRSQKLSGGNKRKLSVVMAMVGNPRLRFFDQPSSGVDPISRKFLWKMLTTPYSIKPPSIVLTTHSMHQAQSLCTRLGILIKGRFVCLGSPSQLKQRLGNGYQIRIFCEYLCRQQVKKHLQKINYQQLWSDDQNMMIIRIQFQDFVFSQIFQILEDVLVKKQVINDYQIVQATLQQIFLYFSKQQQQQQVANFKEPWQVLCCQIGNGGCSCL